MNVHIHKWHTFGKPDMLMCDCDTVTSIDALLKNTATQAALTSKVQTLSNLMFNHELKKPARDKYYSWVMAQSGISGNEIAEQGKLL